MHDSCVRHKATHFKTLSYWLIIARNLSLPRSKAKFDFCLTNSKYSCDSVFPFQAICSCAAAFRHYFRLSSFKAGLSFILAGCPQKSIYSIKVWNQPSKSVPVLKKYEKLVKNKLRYFIGPASSSC